VSIRGVHTKWSRAFAIAAISCLLACGPESTPAVAVAIASSPTAASIQIATQLQLSASVTGTEQTRVAWRVAEGMAGGSITQDGLYTAPATVGSYRVIATSAADPSQSASALIEVIDAPPLVSSVVVGPRDAKLEGGSKLQFGAMIDGAVGLGVRWSVIPGGAGGTIDPVGLYTAPNAPGSDTIVAASNIDPEERGSATVTTSASRSAGLPPSL